MTHIRKPWLLAFLAGAVGALGMAPFHVLPALMLSLSGAVYLYTTSTHAKAAAKVGYAWGLGYYVAGLWWISNALLVNADQFLWAWPLALLGLPALFSFYPAITFGILRRYSTHWVGGVLAIALAETARATLFTGFPWNLFGHVWLAGWSFPIAQTASLIGTPALSVLTLVFCTLPAAWAHRPARIAFGIFCVCFALAWGWGHQRLQAPLDTTDTTVALVQASIPQQDKWVPEKALANAHKAIDLSEQAVRASSGKTLIVWPETALSQYMLDARADVRNRLDALVRMRPDVRMISGYFYEDAAHGYHNALAAWTPDRKGTQPFYSKHHLVPFGEYMPFEKYIPIGPIVGFEGFVAGDANTDSVVADLPIFRPLICYEIIFPHYAQSNAAQWILTVANDAWYGDTPGPYQHLDAARMRAIEQGTPVVRAANTGISAVIDSLGRVRTSIEYNVSAYRAATLPPHRSGMGLYSKINDLFFYIYFGIGVWIFWLKRQKMH